jgi:hypothetical protein
MRLTPILLGLAAAAASTLTLAASRVPLPPPPAPGAVLPQGECLRTQDFRNHRILDDRTLLIDVGGKGVYRFTMARSCLKGAVSSDPLTISGVGRSSICKPNDIELGVGRGGYCFIDSIDRLSADQVAALPRRMKP